MDALRTPDTCFESLPGYDFRPNYTEVDGLRVHFIDEGSGPTVLLLHGEPSWCYLYRKMIPILAEAGFRVVAPDLVGFGRSDKPTDPDAYTYAAHVEWMRSVVFERSELADITVFGQDWGGLIGLRLVAEHPDRFARVVVGNTGLPTGDQQMSEAFLRWRQFSQTTPSLPIGAIVRSGCVRPMPDEVTAAYDAPFPTDEHKVGARRFPALVPADPTDPAAPAQKRAWQALKKFDRPFLCAFSDSDPVTGGGERAFLSSVPGCAGQVHVTIGNAGHFLQEDAGPELAAVISEFIHKTG